MKTSRLIGAIFASSCTLKYHPHLTPLALVDSLHGRLREEFVVKDNDQREDSMKIRHMTKHAAVSLVLFTTVVFASLPAKADIVTFHFTGRLTVADPTGNVIDGDTDGYTPITADLTIDTAFTGGGLNPGALIGSSTLDVYAGGEFLGDTPRFYGMTLAYGGSGVIGNFFVDWQAESSHSGAGGLGCHRSDNCDRHMGYRLATGSAVMSCGEIPMATALRKRSSLQILAA